MTVNHNDTYHRLVLAAVPPGARRALDVGCGEGRLVAALRERVPLVVGVDLHEPSLRRVAAPAIRADVRTPPFAPGTFDLVTSIAALHHLDAREGLTRMRELVAPGGVLVVVGLALSRSPRDLLVDAAAVPVNRLGRGGPEDGIAPIVWPPPTTYGEVRAIAQEVLPGVRYRRHLYFRYSLTWTAPSRPNVTC